MKRNNVLKILNIIIVAILLFCIVYFTSFFSKQNTPISSSKINLILDEASWKYDSINNVYYQLGVPYCAKQLSEKNQKFDVYVPGEYLIGKKDSNGTYKYEINIKGKKAGYNAETAPIIISIQSKESIEQEVHEKYNYEDIVDYINEGYIYIWPGMRGLKENKKAESDEEYSNAIIDGITDLKALVRFCRFNDRILPGNVEKIIAYGINGGGTKSAILGASGDSELYSSKLLAIGAIMTNDEGKGMSDSVNGTTCASPINNLEISKKSYAWINEQYIDAKDSEKQKKISEAALEYSSYINKMKLKSEDGTLLYLNETNEGIYTSGTYSNYMLAQIEKSINMFLQNTTFPYTSVEENITYATAKEYVESLNASVRWIMYDENTNSVKINSFKDFANFYKDKNIKEDDKKSLDEYNPYYFLSDKYSGKDSSYISRNWNICTLIDEKYSNFLPEDNLKLILQKNEDVRKIDYTCIWAKDYSNKEKNQIVFESFKKWLNNLYSK